MCEGRTDEVALNLKAVIFSGDIHAVEAKYHRRCYQTFKVSPNQEEPEKIHEI